MALRSVGDVRCASSSITSMELEMHRTPALLSDLVPEFYVFPDLEPEMGSQRPSDVNIDEFKINKETKFKFSNKNETLISRNYLCFF